MAKHLTTVAILLMLVFPAVAFPEEAPAAGGTAASTDQADMSDWEFPPAQHFLMLPYAYTFLGYRFTSFNGGGSRRAAEFDYLHDSVAGGLELHYYPSKWIIDMDLDVKNRHDHDAGVRIRYDDLLKIDYTHTGLFHNQDHYQVVQFGGTDTDPNQLFGVKVDMNDLRLTLKDPGRPYKVYVNLRNFDKWGTTQQRFAFFQSRARDIDWTTKELTAGASINVLCLFDLDYHHVIKTFDSNKASFLVNDGFAFIPGYAHNLTANLETNENWIGLHTDLSKPATLSATVTWGDKKNKFSGSKTAYDREYGDVSYRASDNLFFAVKYGHQNLVVRNARSLNVPPPFNLLGVPMEIEKDSISQFRDRGTASVTYYPHPKLMLLAKYDVDSVGRTNAPDWSSETFFNVTKYGSITHKGTVSATYSPIKHTKIRAGFSYARNGDPSRNVDFENAYEGWVRANWVPKPGLTLNGHARIFDGDNPGNIPGVVADALDRHTSKDNVGAGVTWYAVDGLVLGANYNYVRKKTTTNLLFFDFVNGDIPSPHSPSFDTNHNYGVFAKYCFRFPLELQADFSQDWSRGRWRAGVDDTTTGTPLGDFTDQKIRVTKGSIKAEYTIWKGWGTRLCYTISDFKDLAPKDVTGDRSGTAQTGTALLTKAW